MSLAAIIETVEGSVAAEPERAHFALRVSGSLVGPLRFEMRSGRHTITADEPAAFGGENTGPSPTQYALAALASCQAITYRYWAARLRIELDSIDVEVEGDFDLRGLFGLPDAGRVGFSAIRVHVTPHGPERPERYRELADTVDEHCPILDLFQAETPVERRMSLLTPEG
ncbi:MAG: OsmC family protein [Actinobacteria bacterium]|nr:OsmC family protein [Actinomycetota bacterium]